MYESHLARRAIGLFARTLALGITGLVLLGAPAIARAQGTVFTYQGQLKNNGSPANGSFNMTFNVYPTLSGGGPLGPTLTFDGAGGNPPPVSVTNGLFTVELDFGAVFGGAPRWLEIAVNATPLAPRQPITSTPYCQRSAAAQLADVAAYANAPWQTSGLNLFYNDGNVGIGTSTPTAKLQIAGAPGVDGIRFPDGTLQTTGAVGQPGYWTANGTNIFKNNAGFVGIGTSTPAQPLTVQTATNAYGFSHTNGTINLSSYIGGGGNGGYVGTRSNHSLHLYAADSGPLLTVNPNSNIGIGTLLPLSKLDITATGDGAELLRLSTDRAWVFKQAYTGPSAALRLQNVVGGGKNFEITALGGTNVATFWANDADPFVGIGTTAPTARLHVAGPMKIDGQNTLEFGAGIPKESSAGKIGYQTFGSNDSLDIVGAGTTTSNRKINFWNEGGAAFKGNISVNGTTSTRLLQITGADLAEKFPTSGEKVAPGTVMEIDPEFPGKLRMARGAYNQRVAGVVSGANNFPAGAILGHLPGAEDAPPIALSGRVWVRCDAGTGAIRPGDLLTTSNTSGHAMKAADRERSHGAVLGKAMTALERGNTGLVLVLVNLQ